jgi:DNA polymerase/3'-5' exonuclease PolX
MAKSGPQTVASLLREYAQRTSLRGDNPYRAKAYSRAADILEDFDFVVASVHSRFKLPKKEQTERILKATESACHNHRTYDRPSAAAASRI